MRPPPAACRGWHGRLMARRRVGTSQLPLLTACIPSGALLSSPEELASVGRGGSGPVRRAGAGARRRRGEGGGTPPAPPRVVRPRPGFIAKFTHGHGFWHCDLSQWAAASAAWAPGPGVLAGLACMAAGCVWRSWSSIGMRDVRGGGGGGGRPPHVRPRHAGCPRVCDVTHASCRTRAVRRQPVGQATRKGA